MKKFMALMGLSAAVLGAPLVLSGCGKDKNPPAPQNEEKIMYGDIDMDGDISLADVTVLSRYINGTFGIQLSSEQKIRADLNLDGEITCADQALLTMYIADYEGLELPYKTNIVYGDVDLDGIVAEKDKELLENHFADATKNPLSIDQRLNADVNKDGFIDNDDLTKLEEALADDGITVLPPNYDFD